MQIRFWGTRGSLAKPGPSTIRYGGNTSCVEVRTADGTLLIIDCGTGAHGLGQSLASENGGHLTGSLLISHTHWDHIQGIPFFAPFFVPGNTWDIYAPQGFSETLRTTLAGQMEYTYFPITAEAFGATLNYHHVSEGCFDIGDVRVYTRFLNHPALTIGYRIEADGAAFVYACDHEPHSRSAALAGGALEGQDRLHCEFLRDADLVIHDAQYTAEEYPAKAGWGHSTIEYAVNVCAEASVRTLALTHHDPLRDDAAVDSLLASAKYLASDSDLEVVAAYEGLTIDLAGSPDRSPRERQQPAATALAANQSLLVLTNDPHLFQRIAAVARSEDLIPAQARGGEELRLSLERSPPALVMIDADSVGHDVTAISRGTIPTIVLGGEGATNNNPTTEHVEAGWTPEYLRARIRTWLMRAKFAHVPAAIPEDEVLRLNALHNLQILDTPREERFDRLTRIASRMFDVPTSLISLVDEDRQWFKSKQGLEANETPRHMSFCAHAVAERAPLIVPDALMDPRFAANPLVVGDPRIRFYAGVPIRAGGQPVGTLCLIDQKPRTLSDKDIEALYDLGFMVEQELQRKRSSQPGALTPVP